MALPLVEPHPVADGRVHAIVSGYLQPWSRIGPWLSVLRPFLNDGSMVLHVLLGSHWGQSGEIEMPRDIRNALGDGVAVSHQSMRFEDFRTLMSRCHLNIDVFERNPERELAMVTRTVTALSCGVPTVHVPFTEVSPLIERYDAGWLVEEDDRAGIRSAFAEALDPNRLAAKRAGARELGSAVIEPGVAVAPLSALVGGWAGV